jgi:hypothetical protein
LRFSFWVKASLSGAVDGLPLALEVGEDRRLLHLQPDEQAHADEDDREQERQAPAPVLEVGVAHDRLQEQHDHQRDEQAERRGDLDERRVEPALLVGNVLRDVDRRAAVLTAEGQALQYADGEQRDRSRDSDGLVGGQDADRGGRAAHDEEGDEEGVLATDEVSDPPEEDRAERPHDEADREGRQVRDEGEGVVAGRVELRRDDRRERAEDVEVVPLDHGPGRRCADHLPDLARR